jgi:nucleotide-binding universal stress UspA family protein
MKAERILVPLDGSPLAERALPTALELLSDEPRATLILLRTAEATTAAGIDRIDAQGAAVLEAQSYLAAVAERLRDQGIARVVRSVWCSSAANAIVEAARVRCVNLIVMATHGGNGRRESRGSVADSVLRRARIPIVLVSASGAVELGARDDTGASERGRRAAHLMSSARPFDPARSQ